jgi:hypothetical protein
MPTYKNNSAAHITTIEGLTSRVVKPNQTVESLYRLDRHGLTEIENTPYYNPIVSETTITTGNNNIVQITGKLIHISVISGSAILYINDKLNTPPLTITTGNILNLETENKIKQLIFEFTLDGEIKITQSMVPVYSSSSSPGTASSTSIGNIGVSNIEITSSFTRPTEGSITPYSAKDVISPILTFSNCAKDNGGGGNLTKARLSTNSPTAMLGASCRLHLYNQSPSAVTDNSLFTLLWADRAKHIGYLDFPALAIEGAGSDMSTSLWVDMPLNFKCYSTSRNLYGILILLTPGSAQISAQEFYLVLNFEQY